MDIAGWLRGRGLGRYEPAFRGRGIDVAALSALTADDLTALGVTSIGHRRKLLAAIAALRGGTHPAEVVVAARSEPWAAAGLASPEAARRQLTVMFCDLVGSTELAVRLDPEDLREVIRAYHGCILAAVERFEGCVAKYMGDGALAYFGYPQAHEDDPERAVHAGLTVVEAVVARLRPWPDVTPRVRIAIATGLVVVGDPGGAGLAAGEQAVVGEALNQAARLQGVAEPNTVIIGASTRRLVGGLFELADLGPHALRGFAEPVRAWRVLGRNRVDGRFEGRRAAGAGLTPLVGREPEIALLLDRWQRARRGEGQVVLLSGEPGIGKSRLVRALRERLGGEDFTPLTYHCSPYHVSSALHPVVEQLERAAGFRRDDPPGRKLDRLEALLAEGTADVAAVAPLFAELLAIPTEGRYPPPDLTPRRRKELLAAALLAQLEGLAAKQPVLEVIEDAHWIDPTTVEVLGRAAERVRGLPVLLVIISRPEFEAPWTGHAHVTALSLGPLDRRQAATMVGRVTAGRTLPDEVVDQIVAETDGVPLFVEELTKAVLESGPPREEDRGYALAGPLAPLAVPATLQDSLTARLDRVGPAKEVAQVGAAIGREFSYELLAAVAPLGEAELRTALDRLVEAGLVFHRGGKAAFRFKHALVQDAAYQSLLKGRRRLLHADIARALEERFPETGDAVPELLAHHFTEAGLVEPAVAYRLKAGQRAARRSSNVEAIGHLTQGLELLATLPEGAERSARELELLTALGPTLLAARGFASAEVEGAYQRARALCERVGNPQQRVTVLRGLWAFHLVRAELDTAREVAEQLVGLAVRERSRTFRVEAHRPLGQSLFYLGEFAAARDNLLRSLALYDLERHRSHVFHYGSDSRIVSLSYVGWTLWFLGYPDRALARSERALALARDLGHPFTLAQTLADATYLHPLRGEVRLTAERAEATLAYASEHGFPYWAAIGEIHLGWALAVQGAWEAGVERLRAGLDAYRATGATLALPWFLAMLAEARAAGGGGGRTEEALGDLGEALAIVERTGERFWEAELHRLRGELVLRQGAGDAGAEAEACFRRARDVARRQGACSWELRAAMSLAHLWCDGGKRNEARDLLASIYSWFTEGFDTRDLKNARALLDELN